MNGVETDSPAGRLDPDELAALEEERDFLLRSLDDLRRERDVGDIDDADFRSLSDDYTVRTAEVLRAIDERRTVFESAGRRRSSGRTFALVAGILVVGVLAGVLVSQASGRRESGEGVSGAGAVPRTATQQANDCLTFTSGGQIAKAVDCYRKVLDRDPRNSTALTYLGWTLVISSGSIEGATGQQALETGKEFIDRAIASDPTFPDAYAFRAVVADREGRTADAKAALDKLDTLDPPAEIRALTQPMRERLDKAGPTTTTTPSTPSTTPAP